jgi:hypothetical protein
MANVNDLSFDELVPSQSKYLAKSDVGQNGRVLTIKGFRMEAIKSDDGDEDKMICHWVETDAKPMVVNRTNAQLFSIATGVLKVGDAKGKKVLVYNDPTIQFGGRVTGGLRIKAVPAVQDRQPGADDDFNDSVPF